MQKIILILRVSVIELWRKVYPIVASIQYKLEYFYIRLIHCSFLECLIRIHEETNVLLHRYMYAHSTLVNVYIGKIYSWHIHFTSVVKYQLYSCNIAKFLKSMIATPSSIATAIISALSVCVSSSCHQVLKPIELFESM